MCTAVTYRNGDFYFGRTLDYDCTYGEEVVILPRNRRLCFREAEAVSRHYAIIGMAHVAEEYPLYYDAMNEKGLCMAGLNFVGNAVYGTGGKGKDKIAHFELIPWILGQCATVREAKEKLGKLSLTDIPFGDAYPAAELHWLLADREESVTVEPVGELRVYENPAGVLTNNPPFPEQLFQLNRYMQLSPGQPENRFSDKLKLCAFSRGMGALGLPGDFSSQSRFVRAAFVMLNAVSGMAEEENAGQFFHILDSVSQPRGCCDVGGGRYEITVYSSCCNASRGIYYYTTYGNRQITAVDMHRENMDGEDLVRYPLLTRERIFRQNG